MSSLFSALVPGRRLVLEGGAVGSATVRAVVHRRSVERVKAVHVVVVARDAKRLPSLPFRSPRAREAHDERVRPPIVQH